MLKLTFSIILLWPGVKEGIGRKEGEGTGRRKGKEGRGRKERGWNKRCHFNGNNSSIKTKKNPLSRRQLAVCLHYFMPFDPSRGWGWGGQ